MQTWAQTLQKNYFLYSLDVDLLKRFFHFSPVFVAVLED